MIIYNVTVNIDNAVADEWLKWMKAVHVPDVMRTGLFISNHIYKILADEDSGGQSYSVQYVCENMEKYDTYREKFAAALQADHAKKYKDRFVAFRTLLEST